MGMTDTETEQQIKINSTDVAALNAARKVLDQIAEKATYDFDTQDSGRLAEAADIAEEAIFNVLNVAHSWCRVPLTHDQLHIHGAKDPEPEDEQHSVRVDRPMSRGLAEARKPENDEHSFGI